MTTKVTICNHGPDVVLVRAFACDNEPGDNSKGYTSVDFVAPGTFKEFYVHQNQALDVTEDRDTR